MQNEPMKTVISPEWQKKAGEIYPTETESNILNVVNNISQTDYLKGAEAYASSVEKLLKDNIESDSYSLSRVPPDFEATCGYLSTRIIAFEELLKQIQTLKPL